MVFNNYSFTENQLQSRIEQITGKADSILNKETLNKILGMVDLTTLEGTDTYSKVDDLCDQAISIKEQRYDSNTVAAICVYPVFVNRVKNKLKDTGILTASVAGAFPSGQAPLHVKLEEIKFAVDQGADEIDTVISRGKLLSGEYNEVFDELSAIREVASEVHLKIILETGELRTIKNIRKASELAINAGADFIKTSTGKIQPAATLPAAIVMIDTISEFFSKTGEKIGFKPAGGISDPVSAATYFLLVKDVLGDDWLTKELFRIGASRLVNNLIEAESAL